MTAMRHQPTNPAAALRVIRILWAALLVGQIVFLVVIGVLQSGGGFTANPQAGQLLFYVACLMFMLMTPAAYVVRSQIFKRFWVGHAVAPGGYFTGTLFFLSMLEGVSLLGLVGTLLAGNLWPGIVPSAAAMAVQVWNFPTGRPMQPDNPFDPAADRGP